jgi:hypothetical protein
VLLGRPWPAAGEPLFLDDDTAGALELQRDEEGPEIKVSSFVCEACAAEASAKRAAQRDVESAGGDGAVDLLDGRYFVASVGEV